jgi:hypothetical protein
MYEKRTVAFNCAVTPNLNTVGTFYFLLTLRDEQ